MKRVAVFVDVGNLYYCVGKKFESRKLDYQKYLTYAKTFGDIYQAYAYGSQLNNDVKKFIKYLKYLGFMTKFKEQEDKRRINWGAGITVDVVNIIDRVDTVILGSSDADLIPVVDWIKSKGVTVIVIGAGISRALKDSCNSFVEISSDMLEDTGTMQDVSIEDSVDVKLN